MDTFQLNILAASSAFYEGECESLVVPTPDGKCGVLAHHSNAIAAISPGELSYTVPGEKPRLAELTVRYEALRCDIMRQYYENKEYGNVIRIATTLDIHEDIDPDVSSEVCYYEAQAYAKMENYPMAKDAFLKEFELRKKYLGWEDDHTILACQNLGVLHSFCNEREDALACFREAYDHEVKRNGSDSEMAKKLLQYIDVVRS